MKAKGSGKKKPAAKKPETKRAGSLAAVLCGMLAALLVGLTVRSFGFTLVAVRGEGMRDTLRPGDIVLVSRSAAAERGRIVLAGAANGSALRRVIGMPGDMVSIEGGTASVNGLPLHEPYRTGEPCADPPETRLGAGVYLLMPDDRAYECALVEQGGIAGTVVAVIWPPSRAGFL